nr:uncharacterized protein LOC131275401 [Dasypus novemcinctus]XP_058141518.1 uncharacterized protein LOC131275404 [Dasypus novemcinctus]
MSHPRARHFLLAAPAPARHPPASDRGGGTGPERGLSASSLREEEGKPQTRETHTCQHFFPHVFQANSHVDRRARRTAVYRPPDLVFLRSLPYPRTPEPSPDPGRSSFAHSPAERPGRARSERLAERTRPGEEGPSGLGAPGPGRGGEAAPEGRGREKVELIGLAGRWDVGVRRREESRRTARVSARDAGKALLPRSEEVTGRGSSRRTSRHRDRWRPTLGRTSAETRGDALGHTHTLCSER